MHTESLKKMLLALTFWLALHSSSLRAQFLLPLSSNSTASVGVDASGVFLDTGSFGTGLFSLTGAGTRMFWYPGKAAFRAGKVTSSQWDDSNIGNYSVALGLNSTASAEGTIALGEDATASGSGAVAFGSGFSSGSFSTAFGASVALGALSTSFGGSTTAARGDYSLAYGEGTTASGDHSTASGFYTTASGSLSTASGSYTVASGDLSTVFGVQSSALGTLSFAVGETNVASGFCSTAIGYGATTLGMVSSASGYEITATARNSFVTGTYNLGLSKDNSTPSPTASAPTDPLFEVGNGTSLTSKSDALVIYKDGSSKFNGPVTVPQSGDIPMYTGD